MLATDLLPNPFVVGKDGTEGVCLRKYARLRRLAARNAAIRSKWARWHRRRTARKGLARKGPYAA